MFGGFGTRPARRSASASAPSGGFGSALLDRPGPPGPEAGRAARPVRDDGLNGRPSSSSRRVSEIRCRAISTESTLTRTTSPDFTTERGSETKLRDIFEARKEKTMFIVGDPSLRYGEIVSVIDAAKGAGVDKVGIVTMGMRNEAAGKGGH